jgi:phage host-nuclease inhibitor protein Gam
MATKKRVSKKTYKDVTLEQAQQASQQFAETRTSFDKIEARMNEELNKVKAKYADEITELTDLLEEPQEILEVYAKEQKKSWGKKKSLELLHCIIGFRTGTPKVVKDKAFTWEGVLQLLKKNAMFSHFIRTTEEINKENILAEKDEKVLGKLKELCFVAVDQDEKFFVETKKEEVAAAVA